MGQYTKFIGLDVHKKTIAVAIADSKGSEVRFYGEIPNTVDSLRRLAKKLSEDGAELQFVYEAGPCGYGVHRRLTAEGHRCQVVAPSLIPRKAGDRVKTDRRDAQSLARLFRAGELTPVWVPGTEQEAMRDLSRLREDLKTEERHLKQRLLAFLLRHDVTVPENKTRWGGPFMTWLEGQRFENATSQIVYHSYLESVKDAGDRVKEVEKEIERALEAYTLAPVVRALRSLRGIDLVTAFTIVAEIGDLTRFESASQFMAYLGLTPSERSSGEKTRRGGITKTGNGHVRRVLVESAWHCQRKPGISAPLKERMKGQPSEVRKIAWEAQKRLFHRSYHLKGQGKRATVVTTALARELAGFVWAIGCHIQGKPVTIPQEEDLTPMSA